MPVSAKPSARSRPAGCRSRSRRKAGSRSILSAHGSPAVARDRPPRFRRDIDQIGARAGRSALLEIKAEAEFRQKLQFEPHHQRRRQHRILEPVEHLFEHRIKAGMRVALGQQPHHRGQMADAIDRVRGRKEVRRALVASALLCNCRDARRAAPARSRSRYCRSAAPASGASRNRRAPARDGGHARASSARGWRSPPRAA